MPGFTLWDLANDTAGKQTETIATERIPNILNVNDFVIINLVFNSCNPTGKKDVI